MEHEITKQAKYQLINDKNDFTTVLGTLRGEAIYEAAFPIAVYSKIFDMVVNNEPKKPYLSELIITYPNPIVNILSVEYVNEGNNDFVNLETFVSTRLDEMNSQH